MATSVAAHLRILGLADITASSPYTLPVQAKLENATGGERWTNGIASGNVDRVYQVAGTLGAGGTDNYDLLAAGSLTDVFGQAIDADELKGIVVKCVTGEITLEAPVANGLGFFKAASDGVVLSAGQTIGVSFGAGGLDVTTNSKFDIDDSGGAGSTYSLWLIVAQ